MKWFEQTPSSGQEELRVRGITERPPPSDVSGDIKVRDGMCLVSLWNDGVTTSHLAPRTEERWVRALVVISVANDAKA
jgi:hypothetical protein